MRPVRIWLHGPPRKKGNHIRLEAEWNAKAYDEFPPFTVHFPDGFGNVKVTVHQLFDVGLVDQFGTWHVFEGLEIDPRHIDFEKHTVTFSFPLTGENGIGQQ
ncbi:hypothetical protein [Streptomyces sp. 1222.5]|uniref:hypothetical protein n=1 Tax=Streptomyces sp. 1222.5 TaxID=1881026 RepID=UPI003D709CBB